MRRGLTNERIKQVSSIQVNLKNSLKELMQNFIKHEYHPSPIKKHLDKIDLLHRTYFIIKKDTQQKSD